MIICNCNAISDREFSKVAQNGAGSIKGCFSVLGAKPNCGRCFTSVTKIIENARPQYEQDRSFEARKTKVSVA